MKINRRQRRSPAGAGQAATEELVDQTDGEVEVARADSDGDLDQSSDGMGSDGVGSDGADELDGLGSDGLDTGGLDSDGLDSGLDGDEAPSRRRGRRSGGTLVEAPVARPRPAVVGAPGAARTTPRQFLHEVNVEMRKVAWPTRKETVNYASVVFVTLAVLMALIFGLDYGFNHLAIYLFK